MAQELSDPMAAPEQQSEVREGSSDFPTVSTPDQSEIPHHGAVDPTSSPAGEQPEGGQQS
jgi:hypothetical protein